jgi:hypothetical protein
MKAQRHAHLPQLVIQFLKKAQVKHCHVNQEDSPQKKEWLIVNRLLLVTLYPQQLQHKQFHALKVSLPQAKDQLAV